MLRILFSETPDNPWMNLALEEAFFISRIKELSPNILRIWRNKNAVVIGVFQKAEEEVDLEYAEKNGIAVVRRFTSGGAVYHDLGNINFALSVKAPLGKRSIDFLYNDLLEGVLEALRILGFNPRKENVNDIVVGDRKVVGVAGSIRKEYVFIHGSMLVNTNLDVLSRVLKISKKKLMDKKVNAVKYRVTNLSQVNPKIGVREAINAIIKGFSKTLEEETYLDLPTEKELRIAERLYTEKYSRREWNMTRMKPYTIQAW